MTVVTQSLSSCKNNSKNDEEKVSTKYRENVLKSKSYLGVIYKPCGQPRGEGGFPKCPCLSTWGEGGLGLCPCGL